MNPIVEESSQPSPLRRWLGRGVIAVVALTVLIGAGLLVKGLLDAPPAAKRQVAKISILPDTPPPPPPPPKEEKKPPPPKEEPKRVMREEPVKQDVPKQSEQIKMEGAAGDGPSAFGAGAITKDYSGGTPGAGEGGGVNRLVMNSYANATTRALNDHLARERELKQQNYKVNVNVWLNADGTLLRAELAGTTGNPNVDTTMREALARFPGTGRSVPDKLPQPLRLQVSNRMLG